MVKLYVSIMEPTVTFILQPWQLFFLVLSAWVNREQQQVIDFYISQTQTLLESQGKKRVSLAKTPSLLTGKDLRRLRGARLSG